MRGKDKGQNGEGVVLLSLSIINSLCVFTLRDHHATGESRAPNMTFHSDAG